MGVNTEEVTQADESAVGTVGVGSPLGVGVEETTQTDPGSVGSLAFGQAEDLKLLMPRGEGESRSTLVAKQQADPSLAQQVALGKDKLRGYEYWDGVL